jgi:cellulose synthase/poly-beta-1,6-N-acetylglucosamine synthase-like glycosyltransferase
MIPIPDWNYWQALLFGLFCAAWIVQIVFMFRRFLPVGRYKAVAPAGDPIPVSVIVSARNEEKNLMELVPLIMDQDHPDFEVIVVNDSSWDDTEAILKALSLRYPALHVINLDEEKQNMQGKKFALTLAIKAARHECILLTDADCRPVSGDWIRRMTRPISDETEIVLGFSPYVRYPGWLNRIIRFDTLMIGLHYMGFAMSGNPYMGVGRNLCYKKEAFFRVGGFRSHYRLASGDDDLFINQVAHARNTAVVEEPAAQTSSEPKMTWTEWFTQKRRHFTTAPLYKRSHRNRLLVWPLSFALLIIGFAGAMVVNAGVWRVAALLLLRYIVQCSILRAATKRLGQPGDLVWLAPALEFHLHLLNAVLYFSNLVRKPQKWN